MPRMIQCPECPPDAPMKRHAANGVCGTHYATHRRRRLGIKARASSRINCPRCDPGSAPMRNAGFGLCATHYAQVRRRRLGIRPRDRVKPRMIRCPGCPGGTPERKYYARGLCRSCYQRTIRKTMIRCPECPSDTSLKVHAAKGLCPKHYQRKVRAAYNDERKREILTTQRAWRARTRHERSVRQKIIRRLDGSLPFERLKGHMHPRFAGGSLVICSFPCCEQAVGYRTPYAKRHAKYGHFCKDHNYRQLTEDSHAPL